MCALVRNDILNLMALQYDLALQFLLTISLDFFSFPLYNSDIAEQIVFGEPDATG